MENQDFFTEEQDNKLPTMLNVLTILTFIGCAFSAWDIIQTFNVSNEVLKAEIQVRKMPANSPQFAIKMLEDALTILKVKEQNKMAVLASSIIAFLLCIFGAIQMRARKMMGYYLYLAGELLPILATAVIFGGIMFKGFYLFFMFFPILFVILYTTQRKHLNK